MKEYFEIKMQYLVQADEQKLVLLAGSNGRFSHSCEIIEKQLSIPCVNMSISADLSLDYQFEKIKPYLNPGDTVYLPLEYGVLAGFIIKTESIKIPKVLC